ncbi:SMI1/KNR4 family protein [Myroides albus]|uniref:SMI1/KNR4 family protein n=1 Tax=Myroides albus TaxID=2562892 RepID=A0A6I3LIV1_9FLAO|nr:SMI1/KNR4 family protein [Myroides albus]MTG97516.1 SMI1/KNR4 family protein [Myroides albus]UVD81207.1 SMI1/KNR4 family protein [Myroides albus]
MYNYNIIPNYKTHTTKLVLPEESELSTCESKLNIQLPECYTQFISQYGRGILGGTYIRIYMPSFVANNQEEWIERITEYYFWDDGKNVLTKEEVLNSICLGDTLDGDEIIYYNKQYFVLPRNEDLIYPLGNTLTEAIEWLCSSNILTEAFTERDFEPINEDI